MAVTVNHLSDIPITVTMDSAAPQVTGLGVLMVIGTKAANSLNTARTMNFASSTEVATALTAGYISAGMAAVLTDCFAQTPQPALVKAGNIDLVGSETYAAAITAIRATDDDWFGLSILSRVDADIVAAGTAIEAIGTKVFVFQSDDTSWLDSGQPSGVSAMAAFEYSAPYFHDVDGEGFAEAAAAKVLAFDPDTISAPWNGYSLSSIAAYTGGLTTTQRTFALANYCNIGCPFGGETMVVQYGTNMKGRPMYEIVSKCWLVARIQEELAAIVVNRANRGQKMFMNGEGLALVQNAIESVFARGAAAGHFEEGQYTVTPQTITSSDRSARQVRVVAVGQYASSAKKFPIIINLGRDVVIPTV